MGNNLDNSLVLIKPCSLNLKDDVYGRIDNKLKELGYVFDYMYSELIKPLPPEIFRQLYLHVEKKFPEVFQATMLEYKKGIYARRYFGEKGLSLEIKTIVGVTDPSKAKPGTIRSDFSNDSLEKALKAKRYLKNVAHASDPKKGLEECELFDEFIIATC